MPYVRYRIGRHKRSLGRRVKPWLLFVGVPLATFASAYVVLHLIDGIGSIPAAATPAAPPQSGSTPPAQGGTGLLPNLQLGD